MNAHDIAERSRLLHHKEYAARIDQDRGILNIASRNLRDILQTNGGTAGDREWIELLKRPWPEVRIKMLNDDASGRLLRSNSPFSKIIGTTDPEERTKTWRRAKSELSGFEKSPAC